jgi:hypothetical protein
MEAQLVYWSIFTNLLPRVRLRPNSRDLPQPVWEIPACVHIYLSQEKDKAVSEQTQELVVTVPWSS